MGIEYCALNGTVKLLLKKELLPANLNLANETASRRSNGPGILYRTYSMEHITYSESWRSRQLFIFPVINGTSFNQKWRGGVASDLQNALFFVLLRTDRKSQVRQCLGFCSADS